MPKIIRKEDILRRNPHINKILLNESIKLSELLAASGAKMAEYNLTSPFSRHRLKKAKGDFTCTKGSRLPRRI